MSITKILSEKDADTADQLERVAAIVSLARERYGNEDAEVASPMVDTVNGYMSFVHLDDDSKVAQLRSAVARIKARAVEFVEVTEGANLNAKIAELIATDGMFVNIAAGTKFDFI